MKGEPLLVFDEQFEELNHDLWEHVNQAEGFHIYTNNRTNTFVENGTFYLQPSLSNDTYGNQWLINGSLNLNTKADPCRPQKVGCYF